MSHNSRVIVDELLPRLYAEYRITRDPERHAIAGWSSGAIAAFTVAWERPDHFRKVLSGIGTYVNLAGGHVYPEKVMTSERQPLDLQDDGRNDSRGVKPTASTARRATGSTRMCGSRRRWLRKAMTSITSGASAFTATTWAVRCCRR